MSRGIADFPCFAGFRDRWLVVGRNFFSGAGRGKNMVAARRDACRVSRFVQIGPDGPRFWEDLSV